ncbi:CPBP family glutamic-type intramembrane protease [Pseudalkalibacillus hwajinpoensis]|uniref:CPBP family glutamic-type intramembrane protease n=1 Tax=Guptibacillus hwajinpoensis TaxID=208199 RepID=UPI00325AC243
MSTAKSLSGAIILAHLLLCLSFFLYSNLFWPFFTVSLLSLGIFSFRSTKWKAPSIKHAVLGVGSGILLYLVFYFGKLIMLAIFPESITQLEDLYGLVAPEIGWHYLSLILIIIPGEELFWRGFVQYHLEKMNVPFPVVLAAIFYMSAHLYAGALLLLVAALLAGSIWGYLYKRTVNLTVPLLSHLVFDLLLLVFFPLL